MNRTRLMSATTRPRQCDQTSHRDVLYDEIAGLVGGLGMAPGTNNGTAPAIFEAVHGQRRTLGKGVANPAWLMLVAG